MKIEDRVRDLEEQIQALQLILTGASCILEKKARLRLADFIRDELKKTDLSSTKPSNGFQLTLICILEGIYENPAVQLEYEK